MTKRTAGEIVAHPLWMLPMFMLVILVLIESLHTTAHLRMKIDANAYCRNNAEWIEMNEQDEDDW